MLIISPIECYLVYKKYSASSIWHGDNHYGVEIAYFYLSENCLFLP